MLNEYLVILSSLNQITCAEQRGRKKKGITSIAQVVLPAMLYDERATKGLHYAGSIYSLLGISSSLPLVL